jgi:outer membrane protein TolC
MNSLKQHEGSRLSSNDYGLSARRLAGWAAIAATMLSTLAPVAEAQQQINPGTATQGLPAEPAPNATLPLFMRPGSRDFQDPRSHFPNPIAPYLSTHVDVPRVTNAPRLQELLKDGKIYLSLSDAIALALENNFDIAIARYNLDISDTDILRSRAGGALLGSPAGLVTGTLGGSSSTLTAGGGPGGTSAGASGAGTGASGLVLTTNGSGPTPTISDPSLSGTVQFERASSPQPTTFLTGTHTLTENTNEYNFQYNQGFSPGTTFQVGFQNSRTTSNNTRSNYSPQLSALFQAKITQHLLNGFGTGINRRFIAQAINDRRITDSAFRQQLLYTINQVENIYWALVSGYENVLSAQRALDQSTQVASDNRKQLQIGTLAPLDVLNADNQVAQDKQTLITAQTNLEYQQLVMKQAIARNLNDPALSQAPVIPTDRVSLIEMPEESASVEDLVRDAYQNRPEIEQAVLNLKNDQITLKGVKNGLLPTVDVYGFYGSSAIGGTQSPSCINTAVDAQGNPIPGENTCTVPTVNYGGTFDALFNGDNPDRGVGFNIQIPLRNRIAQSAQSRSLIEFRQDQLKLQQLYTQIRIGVINAQYALTNDRAAVQAATATREYNVQALDAEKKKFKYGASTTALVLQQERSLAAAENTVTSAMATYAKDRASLEQVLANTLQKYNISIGDGVSGTVTQQVTIPGLEAAPKAPESNLPSQQQQLHTPPVAPPAPLPPQTPQQPQQQQAPPQ